MKTKQLISAGALTIVGLMATSAQAATCNGAVSVLGSDQICTLTGTNVTWVYDITTMTSSGALALFDAPTIVGDNIRFLPPSFKAQSLNGAGAVNTAANFIFTHVYRNDGGTLAGFSSADIGDYSILNGGFVTGSLYMQASDNTNALRFANATSSFSSSTPTGGVATGWGVSTTVNGSTPSVILPIIPSTDFAVNVQDNLTASTNAAGQDAWIQKKINLDVVVPVPASAWLFGSALGLLGLRRRAS